MRSAGFQVAEYVNNLMLVQPHWETILRQYLLRLKSGYWSQSYIDSIFQIGRGSLDLCVAFCFANLHSWIGIGKILLADIALGTKPVQDKEVAENNKRLVNLPYPFSGRFWGGTDDCDGYIKWSEPIEFGQIDCTGREIAATISPRSLPLEVGYTKPDTTLYHIIRENGLARWPYESEYIHLFVRNPHWPMGYLSGDNKLISEEGMMPVGAILTPEERE